MPKLVYTSQRGLIQQTGTGSVNLSGEAALKGARYKVETITASTALTAADSGKIFLLDAAAEGTDCVITLPVLSTSIIGTEYKFIIIDPSDGAGDPGGFLIKTGDITDTTGDMFAGGVVLTAAQASNTSGAANGRADLAAADDSQIALDGNLADSGGEIGTSICCTAISTTEWFVSGVVMTDDANSTGAAVFTNIS